MNVHSNLIKSLQKSIDDEAERAKERFGMKKSVEERFAKAEEALGEKNNAIEPVVQTQPQIKPKTPASKAEKITFSMPAEDIDILPSLEKRGMLHGIKVNYSELVRAGLKTLVTMNDADFIESVSKVRRLKVGRRREQQ